MKIGILIGHPTQFEGPLFQYAAQDPKNHLRVIYSNQERVEKVFDPELGREVTWGIDILSGYEYAVLPKNGWMRWLVDDLKRERYDLYIVNGYNHSHYVWAAVAARLNAIPVALRLDSVLYANRTLPRKIYKRILFMLLGHLYQRFFAVSTWTIDYLKTFGIPAEKISLFPYAIDDAYFRKYSCLEANAKSALRKRLDIPATNRVILSVAKFHPREVPWELVQVFTEMKRKDLVLLLVGDGPLRAELEAYVQQHPEAHIILPGYVPYPELPSIYSISDLFVHTSHNEVWGVSVAEAMACGLPVLASSRVGAGHDLIVPGKNGFVYKAGDKADLSVKLTACLELSNSGIVQSTNEQVLAQWNYKTTWRNILSIPMLFRGKSKAD